MDIAINGGMLAGIVAVIALIIIGLIIFLRNRFSNNQPEDLARIHEGNDSPLLKRTKYPEADSFRWSNTFLLGGLALSFLLTVLAFSWTTYKEEIYIPDGALDLEEDILQEPPRTAEPPPPPPPPPPPVIEEVPEEELTEDEEPKFADQEIDETEEIAEPEPVPDAPPPPPPPPPPEPEVEEIFKVVEDMPRFLSNKCENLTDKAEIKSCAQQAMLEFVYANIKYPDIARESGIEGTAVIKFVVQKDGSVADPQIVRDPGGGTGTEALRVVKKMPKWRPGQQRGRKVPVYFNLPVKFKLQ